MAESQKAKQSSAKAKTSASTKKVTSKKQSASRKASVKKNIDIKKPASVKNSAAGTAKDAKKASTSKPTTKKSAVSKAGATKISSTKKGAKTAPKTPTNGKVIDSFTLPVNRQKTTAENTDMDWDDLEEQVNSYDPENELGLETKEIKRSEKGKGKAEDRKAEKTAHKSPYGKPRQSGDRKVSRVIGIILSAILAITSTTLGVMVVSINILPEKYLYPALGVLAGIVIVFGLIMILKKVKSAIKVPFFLLSLALSAVYTFGIVYLNKTFNFFDALGEQDYAIEEYYVLVKKDSTYNNIHDLQGKRVATFDEQNEVYEQAMKQFNALVKAELTPVDSINALPTALSNDAADALLISAVHQDFLVDENNNFGDSVRSIYTIEVKVKLAAVDSSTVDVSTEPFTAYISGIDAYGDISNMKRGRSDVNMLATVNPKTHEILLVSIPRDYYVQLHGTSGYRDKLTHAGIYGVQMSIDTLEDLLDIDIDYYLKVNFSTVTKLVDTIGGIDVYSDQAVRLLHGGGRSIPKGMVHMDGELALGFARERYGYSTGDRHRVQNQQDVISAIIKKVGSSSVILTKYGEILDDLADCLNTNFGKNEISGLVKLQLRDMPSWEIAQYSLNGADSHNYTYSMGQQMLYVMEPDMQTVHKAHDYITGIVEGKSISELNIQK